jgi:hypothetical protein
MWEYLKSWDSANYLMGASTSGGHENQREDGIVTGHAYSLLVAKTITADGRKHRMVCLRNPWGNDKEWNGAFSDHWSGWSRYPQLKAQTIGSRGWYGGVAADGKFWMSYEDFKNVWETVVVAKKSMPTLRGTNSTTRGIKLKRQKQACLKDCGGGCSVM